MLCLGEGRLEISKGNAQNPWLYQAKCDQSFSEDQEAFLCISVTEVV